MNQRKYALALITKSGLAYAGLVLTPMMQNLKLTTRDYDKRFDVNFDDGLVYDIERYMRIVGMLLYLTMTRLGITYSVQTLCHYVHETKKSHLEAAL